MFPLKDKNDYKSCVIYKGVCLVVHVTLVNPKVMQKLDGMNMIIQLKSSEPSKHLRRNINHCFTMTVISNAPKNTKTRKTYIKHILLSENLILTNIAL